MDMKDEEAKRLERYWDIIKIGLYPDGGDIDSQVLYDYLKSLEARIDALEKQHKGKFHWNEDDDDQRYEKLVHDNDGYILLCDRHCYRYAGATRIKPQVRIYESELNTYQVRKQTQECKMERNDDSTIE